MNKTQTKSSTEELETCIKGIVEKFHEDRECMFDHPYCVMEEDQVRELLSLFQKYADERFYRALPNEGSIREDEDWTSGERDLIGEAIKNWEKGK